ncbi:MAG: hypothetical protein ABIQ04_04205 [Candidatus Saccharimonadales bacterium]
MIKTSNRSTASAVPAPNIKLISLFLRLGLAFTFAYAAIDALLEPEAWVAYIPSFSANFINAKLALDILSVAQLVLVVFLLFKIQIKFCALAAIAFLVGLTVFNLPTFFITFRDIGLALAAVALFYTE